jgi:hypothetical protein
MKNPKLINHQEMRDEPVFGVAAVTCACLQALSAALENHHPRLRREPLSFVCGDLMLRQAQTIAALSTALESAVAEYLGSLTEMRDRDIPY